MTDFTNVRMIDNAREYDLKRRGFLFVCEEVDKALAREFAKDLVFVSGMPEFSDAKRPISVFLNTPGGDIHDGLGIYDLIRNFINMGFEINGFGYGVVASMGVVIMQAFSTRYSLPNSQFLIHQASRFHGFDREEVTQAKENVQELERLNRIAMGLIAARAGINIEELFAMSKKTNCWFDAVGARNLGANGVFDEIVNKLPF